MLSYSRRLRKETVKELTEVRRVLIYEAAGNKCEQCGLSMVEQIERFGRRLEIHHKNHAHDDNTPGNHEALCTGCHNQHSLAVRDETKKGRTLSERYRTGVLTHWATGRTKEDHPSIAAMAEKKMGRVPWNKKRPESEQR